MIVDLLRNDISKLAKRGSVHVPELLTVETYPTLHTLTSTVRGRIEDRFDSIDVLRALFPCGSITGAPKLRAMEIIAELESSARGAYSGSIGWMAPDGSAEFNVAIRTVAIANGSAEVGLGSAVVIDSTCEGEWEECRAKGAFLNRASPTFDLIETMLYEPGKGLLRLELHLRRIERSAAIFGFPFDEMAARRALTAAIDGAPERLVRMLLDQHGAIRVELKGVPSTGQCLEAAVAPLPVRTSDFRLRHKTTLRDFYDRARADANADEVIFYDAEGFLTEGSFTNLFVVRDGVLLTPPATRGLLPGVLRAELLALGQAREADLTVTNLQNGFFLGNSVRGLTPARLRRLETIAQPTAISTGIP